MIIFVSSFILRDASRSIRNVSASAAVTSLVILAIALTIAPQIVGYDTVKLFSFINEPFENAFALAPFRTNFAASFVIGVAGIVYGVLRRSRFSAITTASGILLILLNLPIIGSAWLFRFSLMSSILIPPIAAIIVGEVEEKFRLVAFLLIIGLMALSAIPTIPMLRPSITMKEYFEIQKIQEYIPAGSSLLVPNTKLRYWVEALHDDHYEILKKPPSYPVQNLYLIIEKKPFMRKLPSKEKIVFEGENIVVISLGKLPRKTLIRIWRGSLSPASSFQISSGLKLRLLS